MNKTTHVQGRRLPLWRGILMILCLAGFVIFLLPVFRHILNIANAGAMAFFLLLGLIFWQWEGFLQLLKWLWARLWGRILLLVSGVGAAALLILLLVLCSLVVSGMRQSPKRDCPTLVVLGCQVRGSTPSLLLYYRIEAAADYMKAHPETVAVLSGGQGPGERISEAQCMYEGLVRRGIDPSRLYLEDASTVTKENLEFSTRLMEREGLQGPVCIVSNSFHVYRAMEMAKDQGIDAEALSARSAWYSVPTYVLREALALIKYRLTSGG